MQQHVATMPKCRARFRGRPFLIRLLWPLPCGLRLLCFGHDDKNDGLAPETAVFTGKRAVAISLKVKGTAFHVSGSDAYHRRMNAELEAKNKK
jgi:hypothetical protein